MIFRKLFEHFLQPLPTIQVLDPIVKLAVVNSTVDEVDGVALIVYLNKSVPWHTRVLWHMGWLGNLHRAVFL